MTFEEKFWKIWYEGQTPKECAMKWLPEKRPAQVVEEFIEYLKIVSVIEKPAVLEIGVAQGQQRRFYEKLLKCRRYFSIDIDEKSPAIVRGDSKDPQMIAVIKALEPKGWDIIFVDGDHSRPGVRADHKNYKGLVRLGGFLVFHDTHHDHWKGMDGAVVLWNEIKHGSYDRIWDIYHKADYTPWTKGHGFRKQCGIGVIQI